MAISDDLEDLAQMDPHRKVYPKHPGLGKKIILTTTGLIAAGVITVAVLNSDGSVQVDNKSQTQQDYGTTKPSPLDNAATLYEKGKRFHKKNSPSRSDLEKAIGLYEKSYSMKENSTVGDDLFDAYIKIGDTYVFLDHFGDFKKAAGYYDKAGDIRSLSAGEIKQYRDKLSYAYWRMALDRNDARDYKAAAKYFKQSMDNEVVGEQQWYSCTGWLGWMYAKTGDGKNARKYYKMWIIESNPENNYWELDARIKELGH